MTQKEALDILKTGRNVFLTGPAGSGKTFVLRKYIEHLKSLGASVGITASTGIAATHMGGTTIHSWSGIGIKDFLTKEDIESISEKSHIKNKIKSAEILIIDEVSMLHHFRLDLVDKILKRVKNNDEIFGGLQVVFCGDFFQLPPIQERNGMGVNFAYHSESWKNLNLKICYLEEQHRQDDLNYLKILNDIRDNKVNTDTLEILRGRTTFEHENMVATRLYSHNRDVDKENAEELKKLDGRVFKFEMSSRGNRNLVEALKKSCLAPETLELKIGAKVMFVKNNFEEGYVNGTLGTVINCNEYLITVETINGKKINVEEASWAIEEDGKIKAEISQYPLRLAWAITIHKSQGMSLDRAIIDLSSSFERGMGYVALSRVKNLDGLILKGLNDMALKINEEVLEIDKKFRELSKTNSFHIKTMGEKKVSLMHQDFESKIKREKKKEKKLDTVSETKKMLETGMNIKEISKERSLKTDTIIEHILEIKEKNPNFNIYHLKNSISQKKFKDIYNTFKQIGMSEEGYYKLAPVKEKLGSKYSYEEIKLVRLFLI